MVEVIENQALFVVSLRLSKVIVKLRSIVAFSFSDFICDVCVVLGVVLFTWMLMTFAKKFVHSWFFISLSEFFSKSHILVRLQ